MQTLVKVEVEPFILFDFYYSTKYFIAKTTQHRPFYHCIVDKWNHQIYWKEGYA